jgi:hypothetical protein
MNKFIVMLEWNKSFQNLENEEMGILFQNFFRYHNGEELIRTNRMVNIAWDAIENDLERMNNKYSKDTENGKKGGAPKGTIPWNKKERTPSEPIANPKQTTNEPETKVERTYKEKEKEKEKENYKENYKENNNENNNENSLMSSITNSGENVDLIIKEILNKKGIV